eukprot:COSAG04_NODE_3946_length_2405_cov_66.168690_2_plen_233_part_00
MYRSYAITIRPTNGLSRETEERLVTYLGKQHKAFASIELEDDERHLHGQIWYEKPKGKGDLTKHLIRVCRATIENWDKDQEVVLSKGVKIAYNDDWMLNYCIKEDDPRVIFNNPPDETHEYYPSEAEQKKVQERSNAVDKRFHKWLTDFKESKFWINEDWTPTLADCAKFLSYKMFHTKEYMVIVEKRKKVEFTKNLYLYANSTISIKEFLTEEEVKNWEKDLENKHQNGEF